MPAPSTELQTLKAQFFGALAHPVRIRLLEVLVSSGETSVQELQRALGIDQPIVSQQLARLKASGIVIGRKQGAATYYALVDPMVSSLLSIAKQVLNQQLVGAQSLLKELQDDPHAQGRPRRSPRRIATRRAGPLR